MNPYDAINHDTEKNNDNKLNKSSNSDKLSGNRTKNKHDNNVITKSQKKYLKKIYSTDRINMYVLLHLKALQIISGDKSRSNLEERMIKIVLPTIINSVNKRNKYNKLLKYAVKGVELKHKMK